MFWKLFHQKYVFNCAIILALLVIYYYIIVPKVFVFDTFERTVQVAKFPTPVNTTKHNCICGTLEPIPYISEPEFKSSCSAEADKRGLHQKVLSFCFYGNKHTEYYKGLATSTKITAKLYPGWAVRLYHDIDSKDIEGTKDLCSLVCSYPNLDVCYVGDLERKFSSLSSKFGMLWRFLVMGDPTVDVFAVRDLDSPILQREVDAVNDWLSTNKTFHIMRDHPFHATHILGGMWGARNTNDNRKEMQDMLHKILDKGSKWQKAFDQQLLSEFVWPIAKQNMVAHDSFLCQTYEGTKPWPSQRVNLTYVGETPGFNIQQPCPETCRPTDHKDWTYC